jgi:hypothetical protein
MFRAMRSDTLAFLILGGKSSKGSWMQFGKTSAFVESNVTMLTSMPQMQESKGCVRAKSTSSPGDLIRNPGLMQVSIEFPVAVMPILD